MTNEYKCFPKITCDLNSHLEQKLIKSEESEVNKLVRKNQMNFVKLTELQANCINVIFAHHDLIRWNSITFSFGCYCILFIRLNLSIAKHLNWMTANDSDKYIGLRPLPLMQPPRAFVMFTITFLFAFNSKNNTKNLPKLHNQRRDNGQSTDDSSEVMHEQSTNNRHLEGNEKKFTMKTKWWWFVAGVIHRNAFNQPPIPHSLSYFS